MPSADDALLARLPPAAVGSRRVSQQNVRHEAMDLHADVATPALAFSTFGSRFAVEQLGTLWPLACWSCIQLSLLQSLYCTLEPQTSGGTKALRIRALRLVPQSFRWLSPSKILVSQCKPFQEGHALPHAILRLDNSECKAWILGSDSALMIISGTNGELVATGDPTQRWELDSQ